MISINRKIDLKDDLKDIVRDRELGNGVNTFLLNKDLSISEIEKVVNDNNFAKRLYSQIENRVIFRRTGIYSSNNKSSTIKSKQILPIPTNLIDSLNEQLEYVIDKLYLFEQQPIDLDELQDRINEAEEPLNQDRKNKFFSQDDIPTEDNTSLFHPIDEQAFNESGTNNHLTTQQIASYFPLANAFSKAQGLSKAPGTNIKSKLSSFPPCLTKASLAPSTSLSVII